MAVGLLASLPLLAAAPLADCRAMRVALPAGAVVASGDTVAVPCPERPVPARLRYDSRRGVAVARFDLAEGDTLGRAFVPSRPEVLPGDAVQIVARIGHVVIRREMTAVQAARGAQRFFARDGEGRIVVAPALVAEARR